MILRKWQFNHFFLQKSKNVASIISTLASHAINAERMKTIAYEVISWGPAV